MRVLVTGGAGFLGAAFAARARQAGHAVLTADRDAPADRRCDVADAGAAMALLAEARPEVVVHLAAALTDAAAGDVVAATRANALGSAAVFAAAVASGAGLVVHASSAAAVGPCAEGAGDATALDPRSVYGVTKAFGEQLARAMHGPGTRFLALRFGWVYGPGRARGWRVPQALVERFMAGDPVAPYPDFGMAIDWTYVDDAVEVLLRAALHRGAAFAALNVVGDRRTMREAAGHLERRFPGTRGEPFAAVAPASGWGLRNDGLAAALGYAPTCTMEQGVDALVAAAGAARPPLTLGGAPAA